MKWNFSHKAYYIDIFLYFYTNISCPHWSSIYVQIKIDSSHVMSGYTVNPGPCKRPTECYSDVIMGTMASPITSLTIIYSTIYSSADQRKHQSSMSQAFVCRIHQWPVNSPHKWPLMLKCFHLMTSWWTFCLQLRVLWMVSCFGAMSSLMPYGE